MSYWYTQFFMHKIITSTFVSGANQNANCVPKNAQDIPIAIKQSHLNIY